ncbi:MAG TPA: flagellar motor protein MotB [Stellaceae bacterium]|nr:flagellar motor protein MotB [Stellaceae bacterium]
MAKHGAGGGAVIIKKVKKGGHAGHHGGAWKVAYADFVTAMMAFFLLLWLLNVTTDVQKRGIADYFEPTITSKSNSGAGGVLGGLTVGSPGSETVPTSQPNFTPAQSALRQPVDGDDGDDGGSAGTDQDQTDSAGAPTANDKKKLTDAEFQKQAAAREEQRFEDAKKALENAVQSSPELQGLAKNLKIEDTPEGLRIQLVDQDKTPMFPVGSADMLDPAKKLMALVAQVIQKLPNKISITGHTDSTQYALGAKYTNWELSADRANATRREFMADGVPSDRLSRVVGMADQDPIDKANPSDPQNRRISIVLLREAKDNPAIQAAAVPAPTQAASK